MQPDLNLAIERAVRAVAEAERAHLHALLAIASAGAAKPAQGSDRTTTLLTRQQLARATGVSVATIGRLRPPGHAVGGRLRYDLDAVRAWLAARGQRPAPTNYVDHDDRVDVGVVARTNGLRVAGGTR